MLLVSKEAVIAGFRDLFEHKVRNIITLLGIILGTMSIVVVIAIADGIKNKSLEFMEKTNNMKNIEVHRDWQYRKEGVKRYLEFHEFEQLKSILPEIEYFNPKLRQWGRFSRKSKSYYSATYGVLPDFQKVENWEVQKGRFINKYDVSNNSNVIVIGTKLQEEIFGEANPLGKVISFYGKRFTVIGIMSHKFFKSPGGNVFQENQLAYMNRRSFIPFSTLYNKIDKRQRLRSFEMQVKDIDDIEKVVNKSKNFLANIRKREPVFVVDSALEEREKSEKNFFIFKVIFIMISTISMLVGGIVIMNIMLASIKERTKEIGVRLAVGARPFHIFMQFLIQTFIMVLIGGILGIIVGILLLNIVENYLDIPLNVTASMIILSVGITSFIGLVSGIFPSMKASKLDPIKALRYE